VVQGRSWCFFFVTSRQLAEMALSRTREENVSVACPACHTVLDKVGESLVARGDALNEFLRRGLEKESV
jgi:hypothetical protein